MTVTNPTIPDLDPSLFAWSGSGSYVKLEEFALVGLYPCRSVEGKEEMRRALSVPDLPPKDTGLPPGSIFIPSSHLWFKPDYKTAKIGLIIPKLQKLDDGTHIIYPGVADNIELYLGGYSLLASVSGLYMSNCYHRGYNRKPNQQLVKEVLKCELHEIRIDIPSWAFKAQILDLVEMGKQLVEKRTAEGEPGVGLGAALKAVRSEK